MKNNITSDVPVQWLSLPEELWYLIFGYVGEKKVGYWSNLIALQLVCPVLYAMGFHCESLRIVDPGDVAFMTSTYVCNFSDLRSLVIIGRWNMSYELGRLNVHRLETLVLQQVACLDLRLELMTNLTSLDIGQCKGLKVGISNETTRANFPELPRLRKLTLSEDRGVLPLTRLSKLTNLEILSLRGMLAYCFGLPGTERLTRLVMRDVRGNAMDHGCVNMTQLRQLEINNSRDFAGWIPGLTMLERLSLTNTPMQSPWMLEGHLNLKSLLIDSSTGLAVRHLTTLTNLTELDTTRFRSFNSHSIRMLNNTQKVIHWREVPDP